MPVLLRKSVGDVLNLEQLRREKPQLRERFVSVGQAPALDQGSCSVRERFAQQVTGERTSRCRQTFFDRKGRAGEPQEGTRGGKFFERTIAVPHDAIAIEPSQDDVEVCLTRFLCRRPGEPVGANGQRLRERKHQTLQLVRDVTIDTDRPVVASDVASYGILVVAFIGRGIVGELAGNRRQSRVAFRQ